MSEAPAWKPLFERSVAAFYAGDLDEGRLACDRLLGVPNLPGDARDTTRCNAVHYARPLRELVSGWSARRLMVPLPEGWSVLNPAIVPDREDGAAGESGPLRVLVRSANFRLDPPASYVVADGGGVVRTAYHLLELDHDFAPIASPRLLRDLTPDDGMLDPLVRDNEDLRPFLFGNRLFATGQSWRRSPDGERTVRTALFDLDLDATDGPLLANLRWLSRGAEGIDEKNWMPFVLGGDLAFVYRGAPTVVLNCDPATGALRLRAAHDAPLLAEGFRGGSPLLPAAGGYLALVHEVAFWEGGARTYLHRLVRFDANLRISALTHPFRFHGENIEFSLKIRGIPKEERKARALALMKMLRLPDHYYSRPPSRISGGERQRVALARALAFDPEILFFDEPLSALDYKLRKTLEKELKDIHRETKKTFVYITHSLEEAMVMSDRIGVMRDGRLVQIGTPHEIYTTPNSRFVSEFIGDVNVVPVSVLPSGRLKADQVPHEMVAPKSADGIRGTGFLVVRPEFLRFVERPGDTDNHVVGRLYNEYALGSRIQYQVRVGELVFVLEKLRHEAFAGGLDQEVLIGWNAADSIVVPER